MSDLDPVASDLGSRLATWTGLDLERGAHRDVLRDVIARRAAETGASPHAYAGGVRAPHDAEASRLIDIVTVSHSWFFRDPEQMAIVETLLARRNDELDIWLAACAGGEEPYSIAMLAEGASRAPYILATDINRDALVRARIGRYGRWALRELPAALHDRFSPRDDGSYELAPRLRRMVEFRRHNLMDPPPVARHGDGWDLILCRNVLMYLRPADAEATIGRLADALRPGGHLILGANDILRVAPAGLRFVSIGGRHILQRWRDHAVEPPPRRATTAPMWVLRGVAPAPADKPTASHSPAPAPAGKPTASHSPAPAPVIATRPIASVAIDDALAAGTRQFEAGEFAAAAAHYACAMDRDPLAPEAAALTGIACFLSGDAISAVCHLRRALALDPGLWQAELYLAMSHERLGASAAAMAAYHCLRSALAARPPAKETGALAHLEAWRADALAIARHKTGR